MDANDERADSSVWPCTALAFDRNGRRAAWTVKQTVVVGLAAAADGDGDDCRRVPVINLGDANDAFSVERTLTCGNPVMALAFGGGGHVDRTDRTVKRGPSPSKQRRKGKLHSFEESILAVGLRNGQIQFWAVDTGDLLTVRCGHSGRVSALQFCPLDHMLLASAGHDGKVAVWDLADEAFQCRELKPCACSDARCAVQVLDVSWCPPKGFHLAIATSESLVHVWRADNWSLLHSLTSHQHVVCACQYSPDGNLLATASWDTSVLVWCAISYVVLRKLCHMLPPPRPVFAFGYNGHALRCIAFTTDSAHLVTANEDKWLRLFSLYASGPEPQLQTECVPDQRRGTGATETTALAIVTELPISKREQQYVMFGELVAVQTKSQQRLDQLYPADSH